MEQAGGRLEPTDLSDPRQRTLGDYRLIREIGRGGMGIVYEAEQLSLQRHVALKVLPFAAVLDANTLKRFASEAHAAAALQHPNIVSVYAAGQQHGVHYYTMELVEGQSLSQVLALVRDPIHDTTPDTGPAAILTSQRRSQPDKFYRSVAHLGVQVSQALDYAAPDGRGPSRHQTVESAAGPAGKTVDYRLRTRSHERRGHADVDG